MTRRQKKFGIWVLEGSRPPLWTHPIAITAFFTVPLVLLSITLTPSEYRVWGTLRFIDGPATYFMLMAVVILLLGMTPSLQSRKARKVSYVVDGDQLRRIHNILVIGTFTGYLLWLVNSTLHGLSPATFLDVLAGERGSTSRFREATPNIPGLTTLTQLAPVVAAVAPLLKRVEGRWPKTLKWVVLITVARAYFNSERLAILEVAIPLAIVSLVALQVPRWVRLWLPLLAAPLVVLLFAVAEYFRSWTYYKFVFSGGFPEFIALRLLGYYVTGFNNGSLLHQVAGGDHGGGQVTLDGLWNVPVLRQTLSAIVSPRVGDSDWVKGVLARYSNPEFNNPGGLTSPQFDFGTPLALAFWLAIGFLAAIMYNSMRRGSVAGLVAYAVSFVGLLELARIVYWGETRFLPTAFALYLMYIALKRRDRHETEFTRVIGGTPATREREVPRSRSDGN